MRYYVNDKEVSESEFREELESSVRANVEEHYDDMLDDAYDEIRIGVCTFTASQILRECDPIAYRCGIDDFVNADLEDALYNFEGEYEDTIYGDDFRTEEGEEEAE